MAPTSFALISTPGEEEDNYHSAFQTRRHLDLEKYSTDSQKGKYVEGGGTYALGGERSHPALEG